MWCLLGSPHLLLLAQMSCTVVLSWSLVMGIHLSWHLSRPQSHWPCCGSNLCPFIYHNPQWDPFRLPTLSFSNSQPWSVKSRWTLGTLNPWPSMQPYLYLFFFFLVMEICKATASQIAILEDGHSPLFAQRINMKGFLLFPISPNLYCGLVL